MNEVRYPHQDSDHVTDRDLADHYAANPGAYHEGLVPHIDRLRARMAKAVEGTDSILHGVVESPWSEDESGFLEISPDSYRYYDPDMYKLLTSFDARGKDELIDDEGKSISLHHTREFFHRMVTSPHEITEELSAAMKSPRYEPIVHEYEEYRKAARALHEARLKEQGDIAQELERDPTDASARARYLLGLNYSLHSMAGIAKTMGQEGYSVGLTDEQAETIAADPFRFAEFIRMKATISPKNLLELKANGVLLMGVEQYSTALTSEIEGGYLGLELPDYIEVLPFDSQRDFVVAAANKTSSRGGAENQRFFAKDQIGRFVDSGVVEGVGIGKIAAGHMDKGTRPQNKAVVLAALEYGSKTSEDIINYSARMLEETEEELNFGPETSRKMEVFNSLLGLDVFGVQLPDEIRAKIFEQVLDSDEPLTPEDIKSMESKNAENVTLIDKIIESDLQLNPDQARLYIVHLGVARMEEIVGKDKVEEYVNSLIDTASDYNEVRLVCSLRDLISKEKYRHFLDKLAANSPFLALDIERQELDSAIRRADGGKVDLSSVGFYTEQQRTSMADKVLTEEIRGYDLIRIARFASDSAILNAYTQLDSMYSFDSKILDLVRERGGGEAIQAKVDLWIEDRTNGSENLLFGLEKVIGQVKHYYGEEKASEVIDSFTRDHPSELLGQLVGRAPELIDMYPELLSLCIAATLAEGKVHVINSEFAEISNYMSRQELRDLLAGQDGSRIIGLFQNRGLMESIFDADEIAELHTQAINNNPIEALGYRLEAGSLGFNIEEIMAALEVFVQKPVIGPLIKDAISRSKDVDGELIYSDELHKLTELTTAYSSLEALGHISDLERMQSASGRGSSANIIYIAESLTVASGGDFKDKISSVSDLEGLALLALENIREGYAEQLEQRHIDTESLAVAATHLSRSDGGKQSSPERVLEVLLDPSNKYIEIGQAREEGLIPEYLSDKQYEVWQNDVSVEVTMDGAPDMDSVLRSVKIIIRENEHYLHEFDINGVEQDLTSAMQEVGQMIADTHKKRGQGEPVELELQALQSELRSLQVNQDLKDLRNLTASSLAADIVSPGSKRKVSAAIKRLNKNLRGTDAADMMARLEAEIYAAARDKKQTDGYSVTDTGDFLDTMEVGVRPVSSCQNYAEGVYREALAGYLDPNTKIVYVKNANNKPVARAIVRILADEFGQPALHLETVYSAIGSEVVKAPILNHIRSKAQNMGVPLYVSSVSQNEGGEMVDSWGINKAKTEDIRRKLLSEGSRAGYVYVDSAGGIKKDGVYSIENIVRA